MSASHPAPTLEDNLSEWFLHQARRHPEATAIIADTTTSYAELASRMSSFSAALRRAEVRPEEPVAVFLPRTPDLVAALLGILHAGAAYVPLDPMDPPDRNLRILKQSGARRVIARNTDAAAWREACGSEFLPDITFLDPAELPGSPTEHEPSAPGGSRLAYILFTSGSTGEPKGVEVEHRQLVNLLCGARDLFEVTPTDCFLAVSTIGFDLSVVELFLPLITGARLLLRDRNSWLDPRGLAADVRQHGVTVLQTGPSTWSVLLDKVPDFPRVRLAITTAEAVSPALARRIAQYGDTAWNLYGPTETTVWATGHPLRPDDPPADRMSAPIGRPVAGAVARIVDEQGRPVPDGEAGELCVGGPGVARGYLGNERLTRERFVRLAPDGERYYRTGDLVTRRTDGVLEYHGRNDDQLKIRGVRLEPREVESALLRHPSLAHVAATWCPAADGSRALMAGVVLKPGETLTAPELHDWLATRLPPQMIPARFVFCESLPLSPAGKVDRNALRAAATAETSAAEPVFQTNTERVLAGIWRRLLKRPSVSPGDHFFTLGGDSLAAVRMVLEAEAALGTEVTVHMVFEHPVLRDLAARADRQSHQPDEPEPVRFILPLSSGRAGRPLFFNEMDLKMAQAGRWRVPCPLYAISHWAQGEGFAKADTIEDLARRQIAGLRTLQPSGPYRIAGFSYGGLVALEIAHQLRDAGEEVEFLFLLDPMQPHRTLAHPESNGGEGPDRPPDDTLGQRWARHLRTLFTRPQDIPHYVSVRFFWHFAHNPLVQRLTYALVHLHGRNPNPVSEWLLPRNRWPAFWYSALRMAKSYVARPYPGRVLAVFASDSGRFEVWRDVLPPHAEIHTVPAVHGAMLDDPALGEWSDALRPWVEKGPPAPRATREKFQGPSSNIH